MNGSSNTTGYLIKTQTMPAVLIASGTTINTDTLICTASANTSYLYDLIIRNLDGSNARNFDVFIGATGTAQNNRVQVQVPANAGNNGTTAPFSLAGSVAAALFKLDMAGNRFLHMEDTSASIYLRNKAALTADVYVTPILGNF